MSTDDSSIQDKKGVSVAQVFRIGVTLDGQAYVECRFSDGFEGLICFPQEVAQNFTSAVLEAASRLDPGQALVGTRVSAIPVRDAHIHVAEDTARTGRLILVLTTMTGSRLVFGLPDGAVDHLTDGVWEAMRATGQLDWLN